MKPYMTLFINETTIYRVLGGPGDPSRDNWSFTKRLDLRAMYQKHLRFQNLETGRKPDFKATVCPQQGCREGSAICPQPPF